MEYIGSRNMNQGLRIEDKVLRIEDCEPMIVVQGFRICIKD